MGTSETAVGDGPLSVALSAEDRAILALESPTIAGHTCKIIELSGDAPGVSELRTRVAERIHLTPPLTRRLQSRPGGVPVWQADPGFEVANHIVEHRHDAPVDAAGLRRCVARLFEQRLDRSRPLWRIDVVQQLDGRCTLVWRIHHALADGTTAIRFARLLLCDDDPGERRVTAAELSARHAADDARRRGHLAVYLRREFSRSRGRSPFDGELCEHRQVAFAAVALAPLRAAAKQLAGASINDAVLCLVAGALGHWVQVHHGRLGAVRVKVPVSLHHEGDDQANRDSMFSLPLPLSETDPVTRLRLIHARTSARKAARDAEQREILMHRISTVSPGLQRFAEQLERNPRRFALNVSNVPGPREPISILASPVGALYSLAEIGEHHALRISVISLADRLYFGLCVDPDVVGDVQTIADAIAPEAEALHAAGRARER